MKRLISAALIWLMAAPAGALTLTELQQEAIGTRHTVKAAQAQADIAEMKEKEAKSPFLPSLDATYSASKINRETLAQEKEKSDAFKASLSMNVFSGFSDSYTLKAAKRTAQAGQHTLSGTARDVNHSVALAFLGVYKSRQNLKVTQNAAKLYQDRYRQFKLKYDVGVLKKRDLLKVKVEMDNALQDVRKSQAAARAAVNNLALAVGRGFTADEIKNLDFTLFEKTPQTIDAHQGLEAMKSRNSDLQAMREKLSASAMRKKAARAAYMPRVDLTAAYTSLHTDDYTFRSNATNGDDVRVTATVSINLFDGMKKQAKISQAALAEASMRHQLMEQERNLTTQFENTILDRKVAEENLAVAQSGLAEADENLRITDLAFDQGLATSTEVLDAIFGLSRARFNHITALTDLFATHFDLQRLTQGYPGIIGNSGRP